MNHGTVFENQVGFDAARMVARISTRADLECGVCWTAANPQGVRLNKESIMRQAFIFGATVPSLRKAYDKAVKAGLSEFTFNGQVLLVDYAKYLLEYLEGPARV